jgi:hypothetical protein
MVEVRADEHVGLARLLAAERLVGPPAHHPIRVADDVPVGEGDDVRVILAADVHDDRQFVRLGEDELHVLIVAGQLGPRVGLHASIRALNHGRR